MDVAGLGALADPTRRRVFELLNAQGPVAVVDLASQLPVSRPAVSQHLKVLIDVGLVTAERTGRRRLYRAVPSGLGPLRRWLDEQWDAALDSFERAAREDAMMETGIGLPPIVKTRTVQLPPEKAFELFTHRMGEWWPTRTHSISGSDEAGVRFEGRVGGRVVELLPDGGDVPWADVLAWDPPHRVVLSWHPSETPVAASRLEVRFQQVDGGTEVTLSHSGWEEFAQPDALRRNYDSGWDVVLEPFVVAAG